MASVPRRLAAVNYYPAGAQWEAMWSAPGYDGPRLRANAGTVRVAEPTLNGRSICFLGGASADPIGYHGFTGPKPAPNTPGINGR